jgi:hypothetical protein
MRSSGWIAGAVVVLVAASGCAASQPAGGGTAAAPSSPVAAGPLGAATPTAQIPACAGIYQGATTAPLLPTQDIVSVVVCGAPTGGANVVTRSVTAADSAEMLDSLAGLLAQPSVPRDTSRVCTAELREVADFVVSTESGQLLAPTVPTDACGKPSLAVVKLLNQMLAG